METKQETYQDYVSFGLSNLLRQAGYNSPATHFYQAGDGGALHPIDSAQGCDFNRLSMYNALSAPTLYEVHQWLLERHSLFIGAMYNRTTDKWKGWAFNTVPIMDEPWDYLGDSDDLIQYRCVNQNSFHDAFEEALTQATRFVVERRKPHI